MVPWTHMSHPQWHLNWPGSAHPCTQTTQHATSVVIGSIYALHAGIAALQCVSQIPEFAFVRLMVNCGNIIS